MKIIHVVESTATGTLSMLRVLVNSQALQGHEVQVIYSRREETPDNLAEMFDYSIILHHIPMNNGTDKLTSLINIRRKVIENGADLVILHSSFAGFIGRLSLLGLKCTCYFIPHCISFMRKDISNIKRNLFILLEWAASLKKCEYIACSKSEQIEIQNNIPFRNCHLVENALDIQEWDIETNKPRLKRVVTVGQIRTQKNPLLFADIAKKASSLGFEFVWVGDGDDAEDKKALIDSGVKVLGWKDQKEIKDILVGSEVYLSTALWEGLPVSPLEAMLCGCIALLSECAGNRDILTHNQNGYLFKGVDEALAQLEIISNTPVESKKIASNGKFHVQNSYCLERYTDEMNKLIKLN